MMPKGFRSINTSEIRRTVLKHLELDDSTLPYILERANDIDPSVRKLVYQRLFDESFALYDLPSEEALIKLIIQGLYERYLVLNK
jgi:hypothetical protein